MTRYERGANFERELVSMFWSHGWTAIRVAGSGTTSNPTPDVLAIKDGAVVAVECKTTRKDRLSLGAAIKALRKYSVAAGVRAYISIKFLREEPRFYDVSELFSRKNNTISKKDDYITFDVLTEKQSRLE